MSDNLRRALWVSVQLDRDLERLRAEGKFRTVQILRAVHGLPPDPDLPRVSLTAEEAEARL